MLVNELYEKSKRRLNMKSQGAAKRRKRDGGMHTVGN